jgi:hypothetical protein
MRDDDGADLLDDDEDTPVESMPPVSVPSDVLPEFPDSNDALTDKSVQGEVLLDLPDIPNPPAPETKRELVEKTIQALKLDETDIIELSDNHTPTVIETAESQSPVVHPEDPPWTLQQFFDGEIDLAEELATRFQSMPVMSTIKFRGLGSKSGRSVATMTTADGAAQAIIDIDEKTRAAQLSFTFGSMLTLRFKLGDLSHVDQTRWLELMRRDEGGLAFLWGASRWEKDYMICIARKHFTNLYAFSPNNFEAAIRLTPEISKQLRHWLEKFWTSEPDEEDEPPPLLTW